MTAPSNPPTKLQRKYARMKDLPARIRLDVEPVRVGTAIFLDFPIEEYLVPDEGADVLPFERDSKPTK